jgi:hypothetical protein
MKERQAMPKPSTEFEFRVFPADADGRMDSKDELKEITRHEDKAAAKRRGASLAKKYNGPVDIAYHGDEDWSERYITTAAPSKYHRSGVRFERLDS